MRQELGGGRIGSGNKLSVNLKDYQRSTHDLGYLWRSSMAPGTLVPFMCQVALPGDTFDIDLNAVVLTLPTLGPLFGSFKLQLDVFEAPVRLYQAALMQNTLQIGNNMSSIHLPQYNIPLIPPNTINTGTIMDPDNLQVNPSALIAYLGVRGFGANQSETTQSRMFNAVPLLAYWEIYKNYYANKQENIGAYLKPLSNPQYDVTSITSGTVSIPQDTGPIDIEISNRLALEIDYGTGDEVPLNQILFNLSGGGQISAADIANWTGGGAGPSSWVAVPESINYNVVTSWSEPTGGVIPNVAEWSLENIDEIKVQLMGLNPGDTFVIDHDTPEPFGPCIDATRTTGSQCGLALKTYQSDLFNNWLNNEWIDSIHTSTSVSTAGGGFSIDSLILARKVYDLLNRIAVTGGSYMDWIQAAWSTKLDTYCISPVYHGGLSKEVVFDQVVSLSQNSQGNQPLGTLGGRGHMAKKHKGGKIRIKTNEVSYIIGIVSLTPRLDYSQGNMWDSNLTTLDDFHKPGLDGIGFQDLITEQMAWWSTSNTGTGWVTDSIGKQPAWINYMTNVNKCYGTFAQVNNTMFMTLNRRYQATLAGTIVDLTTYIDPAKYNFIWAQTTEDAQNFWVHIAADITARRKMSAKIMPNL